MPISRTKSMSIRQENIRDSLLLFCHCAHHNITFSSFRLTVSVATGGYVSESVFLQVTTEQGVAFVSKISRTNVNLKELWNNDLKSSTVRHPSDEMCAFRIRKHMVYFLGKVHVLDSSRSLVPWGRANIGQILVRCLALGARQDRFAVR